MKESTLGTAMLQAPLPIEGAEAGSAQGEGRTKAQPTGVPTTAVLSFL